MRLRFDTFTWIVIGLVLLLIVAAVVTANLSGARADAPATYMIEDSPAAPVYNALLAVQAGDLVRARAQFAKQALDDFDKQGYDPVANAVTNNVYNQGSRFRIVKVQSGGADEAFVTIAQDNFSGGDLFGPSTYSNERVIRVVREDGVWKVASTNLFY